MEPDIVRLVDDAHSAGAKLLDDAVMRERATDQRVRGVARVVAFTAQRRGHLKRGLFQEVLCILLRRQQRPDTAFQPLIAGARLSEKYLTLLVRAVQHRLEQTIELPILIRVHRLSDPPTRDIARSS